MRAEGIYIGEETAVISLMIAIFKKEELSADQAINIAMGNQLINYDEIDILRKKQNKSWKEIANIYGIICTEKAATLDFSGVAAIFVTNSLLVQCSF